MQPPAGSIGEHHPVTPQVFGLVKRLVGAVEPVAQVPVAGQAAGHPDAGGHAAGVLVVAAPELAQAQLLQDALAMASGSVLRVSGSSTANSSPPMRPTTSLPRNSARTTAANSIRARSPSRWP